MKAFLNSVAVKVALTYLVAGVLYIYLSDRVVRSFMHDADLLTAVQTYKGVIFVSISSLLIYYLVWRSQQTSVKLLDELDAKVRDRTAKLEEAILLAESSDKAKSEFISNMSHELKTPLNAIIGFSEAMLGGIYGPINERHREYLNDILTSGENLLGLINDILDLSKIEAGSVDLDLREFSLRELVKSVANMMKEKMSSHNVTLEYITEDGLDMIEADQKKLKQIVVNLVSNAIKFSPDGGTVIVRARRLVDSIGISVEDRGIGIAKDDIPKLFKPFNQLEASFQRRYGGAGFGLFLTKRLVELHGGKIRAESRMDGGASFIFSIPVKGDVRNG
ncbi:MAG TPA: HAMP domain-containing sensor histidine kinase [Thermodesulfovibrionales bacterium]|nr:HAMP domain-containing sensor histidine kinase [Thermodesulfovibrionales bacterium]